VGWQDQVGFPILSLMTYLPLVGVALIVLFAKDRPGLYKMIALATTVLAFILSVVMLLRFDTGFAAALAPPCPCGRSLPVLTGITRRA